jgi:IS5 family transposase
MGEERLNALLQESLSVAVKSKALKPSELTQVVVDTTVQPKNVAHPTDAKLLNRARERLVRLAKSHAIVLRQSYARVGKLALIKQQRYAHAKQFKRANKCLRTLKTYLGRVMRDIRRKIAGDEALRTVFAFHLSLGYRVFTQKKRQDAPKVYALHAPEVECIGKGKAHKPYEFGVKVSVATTVAASKGGQFIVHAKALPGNPYDGHTLETVLPGIEAITGATLSRILADAGYKGHNAPKEHKFRVYTQGQKRGVTPAIKRLMKRRAAVEPVIGHCKQDHRMGRNFLAHRQGDAINAVLAAAGYNFRRLIQWLRLLLRLILPPCTGTPAPQQA